ncbi:glycosyltransferase 87 family protein [Nostocoides sp. HKS02]|uniref:glycosyltransferase 87 family protein n=1 Tax=Nostocoides sp. HKS02 TaxID=1813880 RepID=UPI0012B47683|nr:glycosyltransferase 87 family protein [Tetrasphaera sp. HKS02]QGN56691.1 DUF2029 domain-containing protein [Tetrasphaera sp. HKS02]
MPDLARAEPAAPRGGGSSRLLAAIGLVLVATALWVRWWDVPWSGLDLRVYLAGARAVVAGQNLYAVGVSDGHGGILQFSYPPFAALAFVPLGWTGGAAAATLTVASLASYAVMGVLCARSLGWGARRVAILLAVGVVLEPVQRTLLYGQVNLILAAMVLLDLFAVPRSRRGLLIGVAAGIKLTPAIFVVYYLLRRQWAAAGRVGASFVATVVVGWLVLPADSARFWLHGLGSMSQFGGEVVLAGNQSIRAVVERGSQLHGVPTSVVGLVTWTLCAAALVLTLMAAKLQSEAGDRLAVVVALGLGGLLISPVSWTHHWVWVVPAIALMVGRGWRVLAAVTVAGFFLPPMWALAPPPDLQPGYTPVELVLSAAFALWAVLLLVVLLVDGRRTVRRRCARTELMQAAPRPASSSAQVHV